MINPPPPQSSLRVTVGTQKGLFIRAFVANFPSVLRTKKVATNTRIKNYLDKKTSERSSFGGLNII